MIAAFAVVALASYAEGTATTTAQPAAAQQSTSLRISKAELAKIGNQIFENETSSQKDKLVWWNDGEEFPSLGIGHFIWYPEGFDGPFDESWPKLVEFYKANGRTDLPKIMAENRYAPWKDKKEMEAARNTQDFKDLVEYLDSTKDIQVLMIFRRLRAALPKMMRRSDRPEHVKEQFERVAASRNGLYPLIDYVNFKGEGVLATERYNLEGWGLLQVLEGMSGKDVGQGALDEFSESSTKVLQNRIKNSPPARGENRWMPGWANRTRTYKTFK